MENDQQGSYLRDEDKEEMEKRIRTVVIDSNLVLSNSICGICRTAEDEYIKCDDEYDSHRLISTPYCTHKFCKTCWREYLETNFYSLEENLTVISCPDQDCGASVRLKTIEKLGVHDQDMYLSYIMRVYIENESKQLPAPDDN
ncbi:unnamed protein product [Arabidopsis thaliana]|uniref:(thale cress) hypothetical protein n=1 Tax=Arabidopsis thaliana TaxID=3702 RepID=A0A7G2FIJ8_ARATH|nr:unnamed protein product [Arabidopsis thaliana]